LLPTSPPRPIGHNLGRTYVGYRGHFSGDVHPGWFEWAKNDFLFSVVVGEGIGTYSSGGWSNALPMATNFTVQTACVSPQPGCIGGMATSNVLVKPVFGYSNNGSYQHWWLPNLRRRCAGDRGPLASHSSADTERSDRALGCPSALQMLQVLRDEIAADQLLVGVDEPPGDRPRHSV
jgi:hypothetical protein